ncbi:unnamed protein product [Closterium sp. NIES-53]
MSATSRVAFAKLRTAGHDRVGLRFGPEPRCPHRTSLRYHLQLSGPPNVPPCLARNFFLPCPAARAPRCPALRPAHSPALQLARCAALPLGPRAALPCSPRAALPLGPRHPALRPTLAPAARARPCSPRSPLHLRSPLQPHSPLQPARCPALRPACLCCPAPCVRPAARADLPPACLRCPRTTVSSCPATHAQPLLQSLLLLHPQRLPLLLQLQLQHEAVLVVEVIVLEVLEVLDSRGSPRTRTLSHHSRFVVEVMRGVPGCVEAAALGASESAAALGAGECVASLGASASTATGPASAEALHTFTLDSGASRCFFRDCTTVTPLAELASGDLYVLPDWPSPCNLFTLTTASAQVPALGQVAASSQVSASGQLAASCSCRRAAPHSSEFPPTTTPLQTLHKDVWDPARVCGTDQESYFLLVVDDYTRYTTVFPLSSKADFSGVLIPWIRTTRHQLRERFRRNLPVLRLNSDRGGEFSFGLLAEFCRAEGIVGDAWTFRVWGALSLVHDTTASKLSPCTLRCTFLGFPTDALPWQFYHPASRRVLSSQDVTFYEPVYFYRFHPHSSHPVPPPPLFLVPLHPPIDPLSPQGPSLLGVCQNVIVLTFV